MVRSSLQTILCNKPYHCYCVFAEGVLVTVLGLWEAVREQGLMCLLMKSATSRDWGLVYVWQRMAGH